MKFKWVRRFPKIEVVWEDHHSNEKDEWTQPSSKDKLKPTLVTTNGYLVGESNTVIEVTRDYGLEPDDDIGPPIRIIKKCIVYRKDGG